MKNLNKMGKIMFILSYLLLFGGIFLAILGLINGVETTGQAFQPLFVSIVGIILLFNSKRNVKR
jgi:heme/copper-type cytochrome/quinol oxidase subunit 3